MKKDVPEITEMTGVGILIFKSWGFVVDSEVFEESAMVLARSEGDEEGEACSIFLANK